MNDYYSLKNRVAIVTGGGSGLGLGIARALGQLGASVMLCDINESSLRRAAEELRLEGIDAAASYCDVTKPDTVRDSLERARQVLGVPDILVNNAGVTLMQDIFEIGDKDWDFILGVNVKGLFRMTQLFADGLRKAGKGGNVVNLSSNGAKVTYDDQVHYCASKAAVSNMTQCMASNFAPLGINVNAVCPGAVDTAMLRACMAATEQQTGGRVTVADCERTWGPPQLGRLIQPVEVGRVVAFLCTPAAAMIRGQSINVDAGNTKV